MILISFESKYRLIGIVSPSLDTLQCSTVLSVEDSSSSLSAAITFEEEEENWNGP